jgi:LysR family transcriptional regulator, low CO2-responsive transcriptional regulator
MNYTLHQLQVFVAIVECNSVTRAAEQLYLTQPAVSLQLKKFQDQFEIPIYEVIGRKFFVTDFGAEVYQSAKRIVAEMNALSSLTAEYKGVLSGKITLHSASTGKYIAPYLLADFAKRFPSVDIQLDVTNKRSVVQSLQSNTTDFALISELPTQIEVEEEILMDNELYFIANEPIVIHSREDVVHMLQRKILLIREEGSATRNVLERFLLQQNIQAKQKLELVSNEIVKQAVLAGLGISLMPTIGILKELKEGRLHIISIDGLPITTTWRLVWLKNKQFGPVENEYLKFIREHKNKLLEHIQVAV